jgi:hypothetical protein
MQMIMVPGVDYGRVPETGDPSTTERGVPFCGPEGAGRA